MLNDLLTIRAIVILAIMAGSGGVNADPTGSAAPSSPEAGDLSAFLAKSAGVDRGMGLVLGEPDGKLTAALAKVGGTYIHGCTWDAKGVQASREALAGAGVADRAAIALIEVEHLPYADNLVNWIVCVSWGLRAIDTNEIIRVLTPGGTAVLGNDATPAATADLEAKLKQAGITQIKPLARKGWVQFVKPANAAFDTWTHNRGGPDQSWVNNDKAAGPWEEIRWIGEPRWGALYITYAGRVSAGGRLYYLENRLAAGGSQTWLVGRDAYNGFELWRVPSGAVWKKKFVGEDDTLACDDRNVYVVEDNFLVAHDGATGKLGTKFETDFLPKNVTAIGGVVLASAKTNTTALNSEIGKAIWKRASVAHPAAADGLAFVLSAKELEAVALATGNSRWKITPASAAGVPAVFCKGGVVFVTHTPPYKPMALLSAYDAKDGSLLWKLESPKSNYGVLPSSEGVFLLVRENGSKGDNVSVSVLEPRTGKLKREFQAKGLVAGHCFSAKGSADYLLYSSSWYLDTRSGSTMGLDTVRSPCQLGQMPANGLTYFLPQHCDCRVLLRGMLAMSVRGSRTWLPTGQPTVRLQAVGSPPATAAELASDWPIYRHDTRRSNATTAKLPEQIAPLWTEKFGTSRLTQAVSAYGIICVAEPRTHRVLACDAATGKPRWSFIADGRVDFAPALHKGMCFFSTDAGTIFALDAKAGAEVWRMRIAPAEKYIAEEGQFASAWPAIGGVMPMGDDIYFSYGRAANVEGGIQILAAKALTGKIRWRTPGGTSGDMFVSDGKDLLLTRTLYRVADGGRVPGAFKATGMLHTTSYLSPVSTLDYMACVEPSLTSKKHVDLTNGAINGEAMAFNDSLGVAAWRYRFEVPKNLAKKDKDSQRFIYAMAGGELKWRHDEDIKQQMIGVVLTGDVIYMAGVPTSNDPNDKCELWALAAADGKRLQTLTLAGRPVYDGLSLAGGRLYLTTEEGNMVCFGAK